MSSPSASEILLKRIKFYTGLAFAIAGAGFACAMYLNRYAQASDMRTLTQKFDDHVTSEGARMGALESQSKAIEEDYHQLAQQIFEIAKAVGARQVPPPQH